MKCLVKTLNYFLADRLHTLVASERSAANALEAREAKPISQVSRGVGVYQFRVRTRETGVVKSNHTLVTIKTPLVRKATGNHLSSPNP